MTELPWLTEAKKHIGQHEIKGAKHNPIITGWLKVMGGFAEANKSWYSDDETPWCGLFVGYCLGKAGRYVIPDWYRAKAWADDKRMTRLAKPCVGAIAVKSRQGGGHVTFVVGKDKRGYLMCLGGNQSDSVNIAAYPPNAFESFWFPSKIGSDGKPVKAQPAAERYTLPIVTANGTAGNES